jgi:hypothetical protein
VGKLRIGDEWNAISIIAMTQTNPLKAVAELVENSIDAGAKRVVIVREKQRGVPVLTVSDDGQGVRLSERGVPDFEYVATHICDSIKRKLDEAQRKGIQGQFGIGLLGFWCLGAQMTMVSKAKGSRQTWHWRMRRESHDYDEPQPYQPERDHFGVDVIISDLSSATRNILTGEKLNKYLSSELRDRIKESGIAIKISDRLYGAKKDFTVKPKEFTGERIRDLTLVSIPRYGEISFELYLNYPAEGESLNVSVSKSGTRVKKSILDIDEFRHAPWDLNRLEGIIDYPRFRLAPGTRENIVPDEHFQKFVEGVRGVEDRILRVVKEKEKDVEEKANREVLKSIQKAFADAWQDLPEGEYDWFEIRKRGPTPEPPPPEPPVTPPPVRKEEPAVLEALLDHVKVFPKLATVLVNNEKRFTAKPYDAKNRVILSDIKFEWFAPAVLGLLEAGENEAIYKAGPQQGVTSTQVRCRQGSIEKSDQATLVLVLERPAGSQLAKGLPPPFFTHGPSDGWRSRWSPNPPLLEVNDMHRDYLFTKPKRAHFSRYLAKLYAKELVLLNYGDAVNNSGALERLIEVVTRIEQRL